MMTASATVAGRAQCLIEAVDQRVVVEGLVEEADRACASHPGFDASLGGGRYEDHGHPMAARGQLTLQLDATQSRHLHIGDQARRRVGLFGLQEVLGRGKSDRVVAERAHQTEHRLAHGRIVIDDGNHGGSAAHSSVAAMLGQAARPRHTACGKAVWSISCRAPIRRFHRPGQLTENSLIICRETRGGAGVMNSA